MAEGAALTATWFLPEEVGEDESYTGAPRYTVGDKLEVWALAPGGGALRPCAATAELAAAVALLACAAAGVPLAAIIV